MLVVREEAVYEKSSDGDGWRGLCRKALLVIVEEIIS